MDWRNSSWYHGPVDRLEAEACLVGQRPGVFLVRDSASSRGNYVLSVSENLKVSHYIITHNNQLGQYIIGDQSFLDLPSVIEFYRKHTLDTTSLTEIAPKASNAHPPFRGGMPGPPPPSGIDGLPLPVEVKGILKVQGRFDFKSEDPEDLSFKKGDVMTVISKDEDDWWTAIHSDGRKGSIPKPYIEVIQDSQGEAVLKAKALVTRECPYDESALAFKIGDIITVTKQNENGLWEGKIGEKKGHFPFTNVEVIRS